MVQTTCCVKCVESVVVTCNLYYVLLVYTQTVTHALFVQVKLKKLPFFIILFIIIIILR